jgi:hypothetical protein
MEKGGDSVKGRMENGKRWESQKSSEEEKRREFKIRAERSRQTNYGEMATFQDMLAHLQRERYFCLFMARQGRARVRPSRLEEGM